jgi:hypothetical protein
MDQPQVRKATWRLGARELKRLQSAIIAIICILLFIALRPYYLSIIEIRNFSTCQNNMMKLSRAISTYAADWDDAFPIATTWMDAVRGNLAATSGTGFAADTHLRCPLDKTGAPSSYAFNSLMSGINPGFQQTEPEIVERRKQLGRLDRAPLVIERHASPMNAALPIEDWDSLALVFTRPHRIPAPTGLIIRGSKAVSSLNEEQLSSLAGKRF